MNLVKKTTTLSLVILFAVFGAFSQKIDVAKDKVAKVNNRIITIKEVEKQFAISSQIPSQDGTTVTKKSVLENIIDTELLQNEIKTKNLVLDDNQYKQMYEQYKQAFIQERMQTNPKYQFSDADYKAYIEKQGQITYDKFIDNMKNNILAQQFLAKRTEKKMADLQKATYPDSKIQDFYEANAQEFVIPKFVELKHIFLKTINLSDGKDYPDSEKQIVKKKMDDIYNRLIKGESFDTLCELNSEDIDSRDRVNPNTNKLDRGYLGQLTLKDDNIRQLFGDQLFKDLFNLEKGKFSQVVQSKQGYHIFYCVSVNKVQKFMPLDEASPRIVQYFKMMDQQKIMKDEFAAVIKELRSKASIEYYLDEYKDKK